MALTPWPWFAHGPSRQQASSDSLYHLPDVLLRMPGDRGPESGEKLQVGGDGSGWGWWNRSMTPGSLVPFLPAS